MAQPYVGEIRMFGGNFAPAGWFFCHGQALPISEYETLFQLIGTTYGGDGQQTFVLPDLRGRIPVHQGNYPGRSHTVGEQAGTEVSTLTVQQIPQHSHALLASASPGFLASPASSTFAAHRDHKAFTQGAPSSALAPTAMLAAGGSQPHENMPPFLCVSFIISLFGIFPSQT